MSLSHSKLTQKSIDFEKLDAKDFAEAGGFDVVFIALGTTRGAAGSAAGFEKIDREYVLKVAEAAKLAEEGKRQHVLYCSAQAASATSSFLYPRSKGLTELGLSRLGYASTTIFRPGMLANADRGERRIVEEIYGHVTGFLSCFSDSIQIPVPTLGLAMVRAGALQARGEPLTVGREEMIGFPKGDEGGKGTAWVLGNADALRLGGEEKA